MHFTGFPKTVLFFLLTAVVVFSCKTARKAADSEVSYLSSARLLKNIEENSFDYTHFAVRRINVQFDNNGSVTTFRAGMQTVKNEQIILSVTKFSIPVGRISLTPDSILFINYMERSYIAEKFEALGNYLNFHLSFNDVQAILSANVLSFFGDSDQLREYDYAVDQNMHRLQSEKFVGYDDLPGSGTNQKANPSRNSGEEMAQVVQTFYFDPILFVLSRLELDDKTNGRHAELNFGDYTKVDQKYFPGSIQVSFISEEGKISVSAGMSGFSTEHGELTPVIIPDKYQRVYLN